jgi:hypothetical protein
MTCALKNRGEFKRNVIVQDGHYMDGTTRYPRMVSVPFRMSPDCEFQKNDLYQYPDCIGCSLKKPKTELEPA